MPKTSFTNIPALSISVYDAILCRNDGYVSRAAVFQSLNFTAGKHFKLSLLDLDDRKEKRAEEGLMPFGHVIVLIKGLQLCQVSIQSEHGLRPEKKIQNFPRFRFLSMGSKRPD